MARRSSIHISASPAMTVSTSSTGWLWVGAPLPGAIHCSKMQSCVAPFAAETRMLVSTPGRHCSGGVSRGSMICIGCAPHFRRVGKGALAPCPPSCSVACREMVGTSLRAFAHPTPAPRPGHNSQRCYNISSTHTETDRNDGNQESRAGDRRRARHRARVAKKFLAEGWCVGAARHRGQVAARRGGGAGRCGRHAGAAMRRLRCPAWWRRRCRR